MKKIECFLAVVALFLLAQNLAAQVDAALHCPYCGGVNLAANKFCNVCGSRLPQAHAQRSATDSLATLPRVAAERALEARTEKAAQTLYENAMALIKQNHFVEAAHLFRRLEKDYAGSDYAAGSGQMAKACDELAAARKQGEPNPRKNDRTNNAAFGGAFLGSLAGMFGTILILVVISSGG